MVELQEDPLFSKKIAFVGGGNIAWSLIYNMVKSGFNNLYLITRNIEKRSRFQKAYSTLKVSDNLSSIISETDILFLTVPDDEIENVVANIPLSSSLIVHCSGSTSIDIFNSWRGASAVFYPMQTFTIGTPIFMKEVPIFLEGSGSKYQMLKKIAALMSNWIYEISSSQRLKLHLGAVMVSNFFNLLLTITQKESLTDDNLDLNVFNPLIKEQLRKALDLGPTNSQTGPAIRGDVGVIRKHLALFMQRDHAEMYWQLSKLINPDISSTTRNALI